MDDIKTQGLIFVISSPSGGGKTTLRNRLLEIFPNLHYSVSCTTRKPRHGETDGKDYHFLNSEDFQKRLSKHEFIEHAQVYDSFYGTLLSEIDIPAGQGRDVLLDVDTQGALAIRKKRESILIFILPPSLEILKGRLYNRKTDTESEIGKRLKEACKELGMADQYDYVVLNDNIDMTVEKIKSIMIAEKHNIKRQKHLLGMLSEWAGKDRAPEKKSF